MTDNGPFVSQLNRSQEITDTEKKITALAVKSLFFFVFAVVVAAYERR